MKTILIAAQKGGALDGLLNTESRPTETGIPQRGAGHSRVRIEGLAKMRVKK